MGTLFQIPGSVYMKSQTLFNIADSTEEYFAGRLDSMQLVLAGRDMRSKYDRAVIIRLITFDGGGWKYA
jgi:hypothetical protein